MIERVQDHPLKDGDFIKHYKLTDKVSGQEMDHLQLVHVELPRAETVDKPLFPPTEDFNLQDWWVSILRYANWYDSRMVDEWYKKGTMPEVIYMAMRRLYLPDWNPQDRKAYKVGLVDLEAFALTLEESNASVRKEEKEIAEKEKASVRKEGKEIAEKEKGRTARALKA